MQALTDPLSNAKTVCHLCGKPHLHGPYDHEWQLKVNRYHKWKRVESIWNTHAGWAVPVGLFVFAGLLYLLPHPPIPLPTQEEQKEQSRIEQRVKQIDNLIENLQAERDEIDPPQDPDSPESY